MKVLVAGGCGFLGSHVCEEFRRDGWEVVALDSMAKYELDKAGFDGVKIRKYMVDFLKSIGVNVVKRSILNRGSLTEYAEGCNYIINCAAQPAMTIALEEPMYDFEVNVGGPLNLLGVARRNKIPIALCSTIHIYGNGINREVVEGKNAFLGEEIGEEHELLTGKITPLHASKRAMEIYAQAYSDSYGVNCATFRLTGIYGPRQFGGEDHGWVANFAIRTLRNQPIKVFGTDKQVRDILYVKDAVEAFKRFWATRNGGIYNIGGGKSTAITLGQCLSMLRDIIGKEQVIEKKPARLGDLWYFVCNTREARERLGWKPKVGPREGLQELVNWIKDPMVVAMLETRR